MNRRIVLAYSGDLETAVTIPALSEAHSADVVTVTLDIGAGRDLEEIRDRAVTAGAARAHVVDAREQFARDFVLPSLRAGAVQENGDPLAVPLARALVMRTLAEVADIEQAIEVIDRYQVHDNLWGRESDTYVLTRELEDTPPAPATVEIAFEHGIPASVNGVPMGMTDLIESLSIIAGHHGVGRLPPLDTRVEAPAAVVLHTALAALESALLGQDVLREKRERAAAYTRLVSAGQWFSPEREEMDVLNNRALADVTGSVRITLIRGTLQVCEAAALAPAGAPRS